MDIKIIIIFIIIFAFIYTPVYGEENLPKLDKFETELKDLVLSYYPDAEFIKKENKITFKYDTRIFMIHYPLKTGEWQDARETEGPNRKGIMGIINLYPGNYMGQAAVPQIIDNRYFDCLLLCPYSEKYDCYLHINLYYPKNIQNDFVIKFTELANNFEQYIQK